MKLANAEQTVVDVVVVIGPDNFQAEYGGQRFLEQDLKSLRRAVQNAAARNGQRVRFSDYVAK